MALEKWAEQLAQRLQEAVTVLSNDDVRKSLRAALSTLYPNKYIYPVDVFGDDKSGEVVYCCGDDYLRASYTLSAGSNGARSCTINTATAISVLPRMTYDQKASESANDLTDIVLVESAVTFPTDYAFTEASAVNPVVKIIDAGRGSTGYYTKEVLQRDGPEIFKAGTLMYINHATAAEEAARPEGDWTKLMGVTVGNAYWDDNGKEGAALYAPSKVFSDYAAQVKEKAPYTGVSIRAGGRINERKIAPDGKPGVIEALTRAASIDVVTKAGRGGKLILEAQQAINLFEAARDRTQGDTDMDEATVKRLIAEATAPLIAENKKLKESLDSPAPKKLKRGKAINALLEGIRMPQVYKDLLTERVKANFPLTEAGVTDDTKLKALVEKELTRVAGELSQATGRVVNLGAPATADPKLREAAEKQYDAQFSESMNDLADTFLDHNEESDEKAVARRRKLFSEGRAA